MFSGRNTGARPRTRGPLIGVALVPLLAWSGAGCGDVFVSGGPGGSGGQTSTDTGGAGGTGGQASNVCEEGATKSCYDGPEGTAEHGICKAGKQTCTGGKWGDCVNQQLPLTEACDGIDNDCDGAVDNGCSCAENATQMCSQLPGNTGVGECQLGNQKCTTNGTWGTCLGEQGPKPEVCDNKDNDCDGAVDNNIMISQDCMTDAKGPCKPGQTICVNGAPKCVSNVMPTPEICDGIDNDCNGIPDNDPTDVGEACDTGLPPICDQGETVCEGGASVCVPTVGISIEMCDGFDNNCDGNVDESWPEMGEVCTPAGGGFGTWKCMDGDLVCSGP